MGKNPLITNLTEGPLPKQLILFSLPVIAGNLTQSAYEIVDLAIVGNTVGPNGLSVLGIGTILYNWLLLAGIGLAFGGEIYLAQQVGARNFKAVSAAVYTMLTLTLIAAAFFTASGFGISNALLRMLNTPQEIYSQVRTYFLICCSGLLFSYVNLCIYGIFRGLGNTKLPAVLIGLTAAVNISFHMIFIRGLRFGTSASAVILTVSQGFGLAAAIFYLLRHRSLLPFNRRNFRLRKNIVIPILKISIPLVLFGFVMFLSSAFVNSNINKYGVFTSAVDSISGKLQALIEAVTTGIYIGGAKIIAQCFGAGMKKRIREAYRTTILSGLIVWVIITVFLSVCSPKLFSLFTSDPEVLVILKRFIRIAILNYLGICVSTGAFALFEGLGNTKLEMLSGCVENLVVKVILGIIFSHIWGVYGFWLGCAAASFTMPVIAAIFVSRSRSQDASSGHTVF